MDRGWIRAESLLDGTLSLNDLSWMNEHIAIRNENQRRVNKWLKDNADKR